MVIRMVMVMVILVVMVIVFSHFLVDMLKILLIKITLVSFLIGMPNVAGRAVSTVREPSS